MGRYNEESRMNKILFWILAAAVVAAGAWLIWSTQGGVGA